MTTNEFIAAVRAVAQTLNAVAEAAWAADAAAEAEPLNLDEIAREAMKTEMETNNAVSNEC